MRILLRSKNFTFGTCLVSVLIFTNGCMSPSATHSELYQSLLTTRTNRQTIDVSPGFQPMKLNVGQQVLYKIKDAQGEVTGFKLQVIAKGEYPSSYWLESEIITSGGFTLAKAMYLMDPSRMAVAQQNPDKFEAKLADLTRIERLALWTGREDPYEVPKSEIKDYTQKFEKMSLLGSLKIGKKKAANVPAGVFKGCYEASSVGRFDGKPVTLKSCLDSQVPLNGLVESEDSEGRHWELVSFGVTGARSAIPAAAK